MVAFAIAIFKRDYTSQKPVDIPVVPAAPQFMSINTPEPKANHGSDSYHWLQSSCKITSKAGIGSGSIIYYDANTKLAYVLSCGHLWGQNGYDSTHILIYFHNETPLKSPEKYAATVIFSSTKPEISLLIFKPNWVPYIFYPISNLREIKRGEPLHSVGCDGNSDVTDYPVTALVPNNTSQGESFTTYQNSPRPGRSGGGLFDEYGYLVGICWATSRTDGSGIGYFTSLNEIHQYLKVKGYNGLLNRPKPKPAQFIPILDRNGKLSYSQDYIIVP